MTPNVYTEIDRGTAEWSDRPSDTSLRTQSRSFLTTLITVPATAGIDGQLYELQHRAVNSESTDGMGRIGNVVFDQAMLRIFATVEVNILQDV